MAACRFRKRLMSQRHSEAVERRGIVGRERQRASRHVGRNAVEYNQKLTMRFTSFRAATKYPQRSYEFNRSNIFLAVIAENVIRLEA